MDGGFGGGDHLFGRVQVAWNDERAIKLWNEKMGAPPPLAFSAAFAATDTAFAFCFPRIFWLKALSLPCGLPELMLEIEVTLGTQRAAKLKDPTKKVDKRPVPLPLLAGSPSKAWALSCLCLRDHLLKHERFTAFACGTTF